jgi:dTDP-4-dehydrorhamnose reductase
VLEKKRVHCASFLIKVMFSDRDVADVVINMIKKDVAPGIWHVVNSGAATWYEFARQIIDRSGVTASVVPIASYAPVILS